MRIKKSLSKIVNFDDKESRYIYRIVENSIRNRQAFGIEIEKTRFWRRRSNKFRKRYSWYSGK